MSQGFVHIPALLKPDEIAQIATLTASADFVDGKLTASSPARDVKHNWQIDAASGPLASVQAILRGAIQSSPLFGIAALPRTVYPFVVSRYGPGNFYGWHIDSPAMGDPPLRTDLAMTIFLSDPADYDGGELIIQTDNGSHGFKPDRGDAILYPCQYLHCVNQVTRGERLAAVTWIQSNVRSAGQRQILFQLNQVHASLHQQAPGGAEASLLLQAHSNLYRMWADL